MEETTPHATSDATTSLPAGDAAHVDPSHGGDDHAYLYVDSGIREAHARVPRWLVAVILLLFGFFGWYVVSQWKAQPNTAQARSK